MKTPCRLSLGSWQFRDRGISGSLSLSQDPGSPAAAARWPSPSKPSAATTRSGFGVTPVQLKHAFRSNGYEYPAVIA